MTDSVDRRAPVPPSPAGSAIAVLLTGVFIGTCILKLFGFIAWPWAAILAPIWLPWASAFVFVIAALLLAVRK